MAWIMDTYPCTPGIRYRSSDVKTYRLAGPQDDAKNGAEFCCNNEPLRGSDGAGSEIVVQGIWDVGGIGAQLLHEAGYKVVAISDVHGGIYNPNGIDIPGALKHLHATRSFEDYPGVDRVTNSELLELECDVLVPAATENQITSQNADRIKCKVLAEGANGPTTAAADQVLHEKGILSSLYSPQGGRRHRLLFEWVQDGWIFLAEDIVLSDFRKQWLPA